ERFQFEGSEGQQLAAALDLPEGEPVAYALFAHCFTCGKDVLAARRIALALAAKGVAVLRFDFTGLGSSEGDFANSTFSSNADHLLSNANDTMYVAGVISAWAERYLGPPVPKPVADLGEVPRQVVVQETRASKFQQTVSVGPHRLLADEPVAAGGEDTGPGPYDYLLAGL